jgi:hypothetical protein
MAIEDPGGRFPFDLSAIWSANPGPVPIFTVSVSAPYRADGSGDPPYGWGGEVVLVASGGSGLPVEEMAKAAAQACMGWSPGEGYAAADRATVTRYGYSRATVIDLGPKPEQQRRT